MRGGTDPGVVSGASGDGGGGVPGLSDAVRRRRAPAAAGVVSGTAAPTVLALSGHRRVRTRRTGRRSTRCGSGGRSHDAAFHRGSHPAELIELAERAADAELVHALDVTFPGGQACSTDPAATFDRGWM